MPGFVLVLAAVLAFPAMALDPNLLPTQYTQRSWTSDHGLPQNTVFAISQTADGALWVGTEQGLARFDGVRFVEVEIRTADGRIDGNITALHADGDVLWVGTNRGLYRVADNAAVGIPTTKEEPVTEVRSIVSDSSGQVWTLTRSGLLLVDDEQARTFVDTGGTTLVDPTALTVSPEGRLCVVDDRVLCLENDSLTTVFPSGETEFKPNFEKLAFDASGDLWIGSSGNGLIHVSPGRIEHIGSDDDLPHDIVLSLSADGAGHVWAGFSASTIARIDRRGIELLSLEEHGAELGVMSFFEDREGNVWIGTAGGGLIRLSDPLVTTVSTLEGLVVPGVRTLLQDRQGTVWIGTAGGGLHRLDDDGVRRVGVERGFDADDIISLAEDSRGRLWIGTGGTGAFVLENGRFSAVPGRSPVVFSFAEDHRGRIWAGGLGRVLRLDEGEFSAVDELLDINCTAMIAEANGDLWFADWKGGTRRWRDGEVTRYGPDEGYPDSMALALLRDSRGVLWIGSHLGGLTRVDDNDVFTFTSAHGLCDDSVFSILEGPARRLWMSSNAGIFTVPLNQLDEVARGRRTVVECRLFGTADGMRSNECNGGQQPAAWRADDDTLWFATTDGAARIDPTEIDDPEAPPVLIEELVMGDQVRKPNDHRELLFPPGDGGLEIQFTAATLTAAEQVQFRYRLEGLDLDWVEVGHRRVAYFTNLAPRRYRFVVQARRPGGEWGADGAAADFRLAPRFFETWWFIGLALCAIVALAFSAHLGRVAVIRGRARHLENLVADRTRELAEVNDTLERRIEEGIEALRESDRMAAYGHLVAGVAHEIRHPIFAIRTAAHLLSTKLADAPETSEEIEILQLETEQMNQLVDDLLELGKPRRLELAPVDPEELVEAAVKSIESRVDELRIETSVDSSAPSVLADRPAIIQVLVNLLDNAIRHATGARRIDIGASLDRPSGMVHLTVADDGPGLSVTDQAKIFEPFYSGADGTGLGLAIATRLVRGHNGRLSVESRPEGGAVFTIALPAASQSC